MKIKLKIDEENIPAAVAFISQSNAANPEQAAMQGKLLVALTDALIKEKDNAKD